MTDQGAGRREWVALAVIALPCLVYAIDLTILNLALPAISADLRPTSTQALWIVDIYGFLVAGALITMGGLGDRIGARRMLLVGGAAFAAASTLAAVAPTAETLIAARALLGLAGATVAPSTLSLIRTLFPDDRRRTTAIGIWVASYSLGAVLGPVVGGALLELAGWRSVFLLALPVMALLLVLGPRLLPETGRGTGRLDVVSAVLSLAAVLTGVHGLKDLATHGPSIGAVAWLVTGLVLGGVFALRQLHLEDPLIDLRLFRNGRFSAALSSSLVAFFAVSGIGLFVVQYLQAVLGMSALEAGLWTVPEAVAFVVASAVIPRFTDRVPGSVLLAGAVVLQGLGSLVVAQGSLAAIVAGSVVAGLGLSTVATLATDIAVGAVPAQRAGSAAATSETATELGGALGLAVLGAIGAAVYRGLLPAGVPDEARETVGGAVAAAQQLPGAEGARLLAAASDAFGRALTVAAGVAGIALLVAAGVVVALLRAARVSSQSVSRPNDSSRRARAAATAAAASGVGSTVADSSAMPCTAATTLRQ